MPEVAEEVADLIEGVGGVIHFQASGRFSRSAKSLFLPEAALFVRRSARQIKLVSAQRSFLLS